MCLINVPSSWNYCWYFLDLPQILHDIIWYDIIWLWYDMIWYDDLYLQGVIHIHIPARRSDQWLIIPITRWIYQPINHKKWHIELPPNFEKTNWGSLWIIFGGPPVAGWHCPLTGRGSPWSLQGLRWGLRGGTAAYLGAGRLRGQHARLRWGQVEVGCGSPGWHRIMDFDKLLF